MADLDGAAATATRRARDDLLAVAAEHGDVAVAELRDVLAFYALATWTFMFAILAAVAVAVRVQVR